MNTTVNLRALFAGQLAEAVLSEDQLREMVRMIIGMSPTGRIFNEVDRGQGVLDFNGNILGQFDAAQVATVCYRGAAWHVTDQADGTFYVLIEDESAQ